MSPDVRDLLEEARNSIGGAKTLLLAGYPGYAVSRAYYAMFYLAEAFLESEGMAFSKHSAVIAAFGQHFAHAGKVPMEYHRFLVEAQRERLRADCHSKLPISRGEAEVQVARAERFLEMAEGALGRLSPSDDSPQPEA